ncbi:MAG TPA: secretin N-terminal domain-containing protein [Steroidobacteraceae bacterium]|jgi:hypothetical protein
MKFLPNVTQRLVLLACLFGAPAWPQALQVIELQHRPAEEVIPVLQPLLESGGALSGQDYKLFVRASSANMAQLRQALAQIDREPRSLLIAVRQGTRQDLERDAVGASVVTGKGGSLATVQATDSAAHRTGNDTTSIRVLEGRSAFIAIGNSVPVVTAVIAGGRRRPWIAGSTGYRDTSSGFTVTPRVSGEQVVLDIAQQAQHIGDDGRGNSQAIQTQSLATQVSGRLGEWLELGGASASSESTASAVPGRQYATRSDAQSVWVKVEEAQ